MFSCSDVVMCDTSHQGAAGMKTPWEVISIWMKTEINFSGSFRYHHDEQLPKELFQLLEFIYSLQNQLVVNCRFGAKGALDFRLDPP